MIFVTIPITSSRPSIEYNPHSQSRIVNFPARVIMNLVPELRFVTCGLNIDIEVDPSRNGRLKSARCYWYRCLWRCSQAMRSPSFFHSTSPGPLTIIAQVVITTKMAAGHFFVSLPVHQGNPETGNSLVSS